MANKYLGSETQRAASTAVPQIGELGYTEAGLFVGDGVTQGKFMQRLLRSAETYLDVRDFGGKCDGTASQTGTMTSGSNLVTDPTPPTLLPVNGQKVTVQGAGTPTTIATVSSVAIGTVLPCGITTSVVTFTAAHGLLSGQVFTLSGVGGATEANGRWTVFEVLSSTSLAITVNVVNAYTSGGVATVVPHLSGYVSAVAVTSGTLTFRVVSAPGGSTAVNAAATTTGGALQAWFASTDDLTAWTNLFTKAAAVGNAVVATWRGVSGVSGVLPVPGGVMLHHPQAEYVNGDGVESNSSLAMRGGVIRAHAGFTNARTAALIQLGTSKSSAVYTKSGFSSANLFGGTYDAFDCCQSAVRMFSSRNTAYNAVAMNGIDWAWWVDGSNGRAVHCIGAQTNAGDVLRVTGTDSKWHGGYLRQGAFMCHVTGANAVGLYLGDGVHMFNGFNGGGSVPGADVFVDTSGSFKNLNVDGAEFDGVLGPQILIRPLTGGSVASSVIAPGITFQPNNGFPDNTYPFLSLDSTYGVIASITLGPVAGGSASGNTYSAVTELIGGAGSISRISLLGGTWSYCKAVYKLTNPSGVANTVDRTALTIGPFQIYDGASTRKSENVTTGSYYTSTTQYTDNITFFHGCAGALTHFELSPADANTPGMAYWLPVSTNAVQVFFNRGIPKSTTIHFSYRAMI